MLRSLFLSFVSASLLSSVAAHGGHHHHARAESFPEITTLLEQNKQFVVDVEQKHPGLLKSLADDGQTPEFMFLGCSDSRVSEGTIFNAAPGTFFTERNIANQYSPNDVNTDAVLSYGVTVLGIKHVVVLGHVGCGGVAAAIASRPEAPIDAAGAAVQTWIEPIRQIFATSTRPEIVELRERNAGKTVGEPENDEPGFIALVEENVKAGVSRIAESNVIKNQYRALAELEAGGGEAAPAEKKKRAEELAPIIPVFVHGWIYDIRDGSIRDLGVSVGPPGHEVSPTPSGEATTTAAEATSTAARATTTAAEATTTAGEATTSAAEATTTAAEATSTAAEATSTAAAATSTAAAAPTPEAQRAPAVNQDAHVIGHTTVAMPAGTAKAKRSSSPMGKRRLGMVRRHRSARV